MRAGVHGYAVTPFQRDDIYKVDFEGLESNLDFMARAGVPVIVVSGGTGEIEALSEAEQLEIARTAVRAVSGRAAVMAGIPNGIGIAADLIPKLAAVGIEGVVAMSPRVRGKEPDDAGVVEYFKALSECTTLPLMAYNQQRWGLSLFEALAEFPAIVGMKDTFVDPLPFFRAIQTLGDRFLWIGNKRHDPGVLHLWYQMNMDGFSSGFVNFLPEPELSLHELGVNRDWEAMIRVQAELKGLEAARTASDDAAAVKDFMDALGLTGGPVRPPRLGVAPEVSKTLTALVREKAAEFRQGGHE